MTPPRGPFICVPVSALQFLASRTTHAEILCLLAVYASSNGGPAGHVFAADTARWSGISERAIREALSALEKRGVIERTGNLVRILIVEQEVDVAGGGK